MDGDARKKLHETCAAERKDCTQRIIDSKALKKIVVAGPGTGKTTLFSKLLEVRPGDSLTLSFINALVDDLAVGLYGLSDVKTLHGYALGVIKKIKKETQIFPKLPDVIREDIKLLKGEDINFKALFQEGVGKKEYFEYYKARKDYYGAYYGFADIIFALVKLFQEKPAAIPTYTQIVVDEYQDFNKVEVDLVDMLATKSPILLAGDDDQALYTKLKSASPEHIRKKHGDKAEGFEAHSLPYCSRSTETIIEAINDLIRQGQKNGLLKGRVDKPYRYFADANKDKECTAYPHIDHKTLQEAQIAWFIQTQLEELVARERKNLEVLVVVPPQVKVYGIPRIVRLLEKKGFRNIEYGNSDETKELTFRDGLRLLLSDKGSNLGWRVVAGVALPPELLCEALKSSEASGKPFMDGLPDDFVAKARDSIKTVKKLAGDAAAEVTDEMIAAVLEQLGYEQRSEKITWLEKKLEDDKGQKGTRGVIDSRITITTVPSSKGLAADFVFVTHFDDAFYTENGKGKICDENIFSFLVALTRARKKAYLISTQAGKESQFLKWIDGGRINSLN